MSATNRATLFGRLGADPELRMTTTGKAVMRISLATNERVKRQNEWEDHTEWHTVIVWGKRAEGLQKVPLVKGSQILVEGPIRRRKYEKEGRDIYVTEIIADEVVLGARSASSPGSRPDNTGDRDETGDDDIPF